ncbi:type III-A CRISPR-associated RAMP protein Csm5 [Spirosoma koreense]
MNTRHVLIETLTPLHIGSGRFLQGNTEYLYFPEANVVAVVDERKILDVIGEENLEQWVQIIDNEQDLFDYVRKRKPTLAPADVAQRMMTTIGKRKPGKWSINGKNKFPTIREQLFSGNGQPILPGSSLKGAIRTAFFNALIQENPAAAQRISDFKRFDDRKQRNSYNGQRLESKYFTNVSQPGEVPNHDVFRFLRVGDAHFDKTVCLLSETLNEKGGHTFEMKDDVKQLIECIPDGAEALCRVQIPAELISLLNERRYRETADKIPHRDRISWTRLLLDINANTKRLIQKEIYQYQSQQLPDGASDYLDSLKGMMTGLKENQCVIRVGFGTGYLNMTGGWAEEQWKVSLPKDKFAVEMDDLAEAVRRNARYNQFALPKSRKMALEGIPLGFLKLTVFSENEFVTWQQQAGQREIQKQLKAEAQRLATEESAHAAAQAEARRLEEERMKAEEARKPKLFEGVLKQGQELDAEVVVSAKTNKVKVYTIGYETRQFDLIGYSGAEPVGKVVVVKADQLDKKKNLLQIRYVRPK